MEESPVWLWPLVVCALAFGVRIWAGRLAAARLGTAGQRMTRLGTTRQEADRLAIGQIALHPSLSWLAALGTKWRPFGTRETNAEPIRLLSRKAISAQHALVLVEIWDQQFALAVQPGVAPTVVATRTTVHRQNSCNEASCFPQQFAELRQPIPCEERPCA